MLTTEEIQTRVAELSSQISTDYKQIASKQKPLLIVGVLRGCFIFLADLTRAMTITHQVDFIALQSYTKANTTGAVELRLDLLSDIAGKHVLIIEDIVDSGYTMRYLLKLIEARQPASVRVCTLLSKPSKRKVKVGLDYIGFKIPNVFVVGYGLDYDNRYRTLANIGRVVLESE